MAQHEGVRKEPQLSSGGVNVGMEDGTARMGVAAVIERYDIIRGEAARA